MSTTHNLFPYPGNKARHAEWIIQYIPEHKCYAEAFGGAAGVLFNKPPSTVEAYNDLNGDIVHFFEVLRNRPGELQEWLQTVPFSRQLHDEWATSYYADERPEDDIERAGRFFYLRYSQFGGKINANKGFKTEPTRSHAGAFAKKVDCLREFAERLRPVAIENLDWQVLVDRYDSEDTVFYLDPPYGGDESQYDLPEFDQRTLYNGVCDIDGKFLISLDTLPKWCSEEFTVVSKDSVHKMNGAKSSTEYLVMNFDPDDTPRFSGAGQATLSEVA